MDKTLYDLGARDSISEERGLALLRDTDLMVYSPGISTAGFAEVRMAEQNSARKVIATTIDDKGFEFTKDLVAKRNLQSQIEVTREDLRDPWGYPPNHFDFIYARLVLHYLSAEDLDAALHNFAGSLNPGGRMFIVVRSDKNINRSDPNVQYDPVTHFTIRPRYAPDGTLEKESKRYFHTPETIRSHVEGAGFTVESVSEYGERIYRDYARTDAALGNREDRLIEVVASKS